MDAASAREKVRSSGPGQLAMIDINIVTSRLPPLHLRHRLPSRQSAAMPYQSRMDESLDLSAVQQQALHPPLSRAVRNAAMLDCSSFLGPSCRSMAARVHAKYTKWASKFQNRGKLGLHPPVCVQQSLQAPPPSQYQVSDSTTEQ